MPKKSTTKLNAQDRVSLFCAATGIDHAAVGIVARAMQSMAIRGFIVHDRETGAYALTDSGRATLMAILEDAGLRPRFGQKKAMGRLGPSVLRSWSMSQGGNGDRKSLLRPVLTIASFPAHGSPAVAR